MERDACLHVLGEVTKQTAYVTTSSMFYSSKLVFT